MGMEYLQFKQPFWVLANKQYYKHTMMCGGIDHFYGFVAEGTDEKEISVPDGCVDIIFCCDEKNPYVKLMGTVTQAEEFGLVSGVRYFGVRFLPGYYASMGPVGFHELPMGGIPLDDIIGVHGAYESIFLHQDFCCQVNIFMNEFCHGSLGQAISRQQNPIFQSVMQMILTEHGNISVKELAEQTYYSERRIRDIFSSAMGISLKQFSDIVRFQSLLSCLNESGRKGQMNLADLSVKMGYYDQAHMSKKFKEYSFYSPKKYITKVYNVNYQELINLV